MYAVNKKNKLDVIICNKLPKGYEEILEEHYYAVVGDDPQISDSGGKGFTYLGYGLAGQQTFKLDAKDGSAVFASGLATIDTDGTITAKTQDLKDSSNKVSTTEWVVKQSYLGPININDYSLDAKFKTLSVNTSSFKVYGDGEPENHYGIMLGTPNGIHAPYGISFINAIQVPNGITVDTSMTVRKGIVFPEVPTCTPYAIALGWNAGESRFYIQVNNDPNIAWRIPSHLDVLGMNGYYSGARSDVVYTTSAIGGGAMVFVSRGISAGQDLYVSVNGVNIQHMSASGTSGAFQACASGFVKSGMAFAVSAPSQTTIFVYSNQNFSNPAYWLIDNETKKIYAYLEDQEDLYLDHINIKGGVDCGRPPEDFEEWVGGKWVFSKKKEAEQEAADVILAAKDLLRLTDRFNLSPYTESLTALERTTLNDLRAVLLSVAKGTIKVMPVIPEFVKKLLEL